VEYFNLQPESRKVVLPAREARRGSEGKPGNEGIFCGAAIALKDGAIVTGSNSPFCMPLRAWS